MNLTSLSKDAVFWDRFAPFYHKWASRGAYHKAILQEISRMSEPGWHVLDIGAATGVIAIPMASFGCFVTALEPSGGMQELLSNKLSSLGIRNVEIVKRTWEDIQMTGAAPDLVIACNSLHLTTGGIMEGMKKVFESGAGQIVLVTEVNQGIAVDFKHIDSLQNSCEFLYIRNFRVDSSFHFDSMEEVRELEAFLGRNLSIDWETGRPCQRDMTDIAVVWWKRRDHNS